jgi:hypothetical protein
MVGGAILSGGVTTYGVLQHGGQKISTYYVIAGMIRWTVNGQLEHVYACCLRISFGA